MTTAFVFPGQGGQFIGQGRAWTERDPKLMELFTMADDLTGRPITKLCFDGPMEELSKTANLQPAVLTVSLAALRLWRAEGLKPDFAAGHSLGEFGALVAAEVFDESTALKLVAKRAVFMDEAAAKHSGAMLAVIGMPAEELDQICELARNEGPVVLANFNTPEQIVISGEARAVAAAAKYIKLKKGRAIPLPVSGAFHSELMDAARVRFAAELEKINFNAPICPIAPNGTGILTQDPGEIKTRLMNQITSPVLWTQTIDNLNKAGATLYLEAWPKAYLGPMIKKCLPKDTQAAIEFRQ